MLITPCLRPGAAPPTAQGGLQVAAPQRGTGAGPRAQVDWERTALGQDSPDSPPLPSISETPIPLAVPRVVSL